MIDENLLEYLEGFMTEKRKKRFKQILSLRTKHITVAVEDVFQAHNTSAVIRSCEIFGIQEAHLIEARFGDRLDSKIAMGAEKWVDVIRYNNTTECIKKLRSQGYKIIATTPHNNTCLLEDFDSTQKSALFFGTERDGLSNEVIQQADGFIKISMAGFTESLNISVSAAIILQSVTSKLRQSEIDWQLTETEKLEKRIDWAKKTVQSLDDILSRYKPK